MSSPPTTNAHTIATHWASLASTLLGFGVLLGAFGAHGLKNMVDQRELELWQTATLYLFVHALGLFAIALFIHLKWCKQTPAFFMCGGVLLFSGSLYILALGAPSYLGIITPIGGLCFVVAWFLLAWQIYHTKKS